MKKMQIPALVFLLTLCIQIVFSTRGALFNETDGQYAGAAKLMAGGGDWLIPENNGIPRLVKPPLLYWAMGISMKIFGISEWTARLPNSLALASLAMLATLFIRASGGSDRRAWIAGSITATSLGAFTLGRIIMPEPAFAAFLAASLYFLLLAANKNSQKPASARSYIWGFWICAGLAAFVKGPHGLIFPVIIAALATVLMRHNSPIRLRELFFSWGVVAVLLINLPWYLLVESRFPGYLHDLICIEYLGHIFGHVQTATGYTNVPRLPFLLLHLAWFFPWSLLGGSCLVSYLYERTKKSRTPDADTKKDTISYSIRLCLIWLLVIGASTLLAGQRQDYYAMSAWLPVSILTAALLDRASLGTLRWGIFLTLLCLASALLASQLLPTWVETPDTATAPDRSTALLTLTALGPEVWKGLAAIALAALTPALLCLIIALFRKPIFYTTLAALCIAWGAISGTVFVTPLFSLASIAPRLEAAPAIVFDGDIDTASSLLFYTTRPIYHLNISPDKDFVVRTRGIGRERYLDESACYQFLKSTPGAILITEAVRLSHLQEMLPLTPLPITRCGTLVAVQIKE